MYTLMQRKGDKSEEFIPVKAYDTYTEAEYALLARKTEDDWDIEIEMNIAGQMQAIQRRYKVIET